MSNKVKVRVLSTLTILPGRIIDLEESLAEILIAKGSVEVYTGEVESVEEPEIEEPKSISASEARGGRMIEPLEDLQEEVLEDIFEEEIDEE